jgi:hypothetical protein
MATALRALQKQFRLRNRAVIMVQASRKQSQARELHGQ